VELPKNIIITVHMVVGRLLYFTVWFFNSFLPLKSRSSSNGSCEIWQADLKLPVCNLWTPFLKGHWPSKFGGVQKMKNHERCLQFGVYNFGKEANFCTLSYRTGNRQLMALIYVQVWQFFIAALIFARLKTLYYCSFYWHLLHVLVIQKLVWPYFQVFNKL